ncbi:class I SAM-dependent methyltransferase [Sinorhizobium meliloti]|uniref:class I SAM-dependent methyltransferase n=1 Tax=Rhizobium meliloti TaxID=382 RepID=UPI001297AFB2|nr:class I SAM-dependent methyltransferase [Sinorhizobium meliloti]MQW58658.1 methyltransferase domain-containing protein [Sinorhizobium meliloti]
MTGFDAEAHWENVYRSKGEVEVSWFEETPALSIRLLQTAGLAPGMAVIDVGGGASRLVDALAQSGDLEVTILDLSTAALEKARARLPDIPAVKWVVSDVTAWTPDKKYDLWHDRAAFHFLTSPEDRNAYVRVMDQTLKMGGKAIIGTFAADGPEKCSGLPTMRYEPGELASILAPHFLLLHSQRHQHVTPWGSVQKFQFSIFKKAEE